MTMHMASRCDEMVSREELSTILRNKGFRITPQREKILDIFYDLPEGEHLSAEALQNRLRQETSDISLATSYRTLKLLASLGVLREVDFAEDHKHYELIRSESDIQHQHVICVECGHTEEFTSVEIFEAASAISKRIAFTLIDVQLKLYGRCKACNPPS